MGRNRQRTYLPGSGRCNGAEAGSSRCCCAVQQQRINGDQRWLTGAGSESFG